MLYKVMVKRVDNSIINVIIEANSEEEAQERAQDRLSAFVSKEIHTKENEYFDNHEREAAWQISGLFEVLNTIERNDFCNELYSEIGYKCFEVILCTLNGVIRSQIDMVRDCHSAYLRALEENNLTDKVEALIYELGQPLDKMDYLVHQVQYNWEFNNFEYSIDVLEYARYTALNICSYDMKNCVDIWEHYKGYHMTMEQALSKMISKGTYDEKLYRIVENMIAATQSPSDIEEVIKEGCLSIKDTVGYLGMLGLPAIDNEDGINENIKYPNELSDYETAKFDWSQVIKEQS